MAGEATSTLLDQEETLSYGRIYVSGAELETRSESEKLTLIVQKLGEFGLDGAVQLYCGVEGKSLREGKPEYRRMTFAASFKKFAEAARVIDETGTYYGRYPLYNISPLDGSKPAIAVYDRSQLVPDHSEEDADWDWLEEWTHRDGKSVNEALNAVVFIDNGDKVPTPEKIEQRERALRRANEVRHDTMELLNKIKVGEITPTDAIRDPVAKSIKAERFLLAIPGVGRVKAGIALRKALVHPERHVKALSERQINVLLEHVPKIYPGNRKKRSAANREQSMDALARANKIRLHLAQVRVDFLDSKVTLESALDDEKLANIRVTRLVTLIPTRNNKRTAKLKRNRITDLIGASPLVACGQLTDRQKRMLVEYFTSSNGS